MFLKPEQQLERCKRIVRQRVDPHIHPSIAQLAVKGTMADYQIGMVSETPLMDVYPYSAGPNDKPEV